MKYPSLDTSPQTYLCDPIAAYSRSCKAHSLFPPDEVAVNPGDIRVIELFAGVGGFRIGLERASSRYKTVWNNQWEPSTKRQDASIVYCRQFGPEGHSNEDISTVDISDIPDADLLVGGFPCQDYSVATTLKNSGGIEGKKGCCGGRYTVFSAPIPIPHATCCSRMSTGCSDPPRHSGAATSP